MTDLSTLEGDLLAQVAGAPDEAALEAVRLSVARQEGARFRAPEDPGGMTPEERREKGPLINGLRDRVQGAILARRETLAESALDERPRRRADRRHASCPEGPETRGRIHPISQVIDELTAIFADMGFSVAEGPDIETDELNFTALNFPEGHPAREMHDTFFLSPDSSGERKLLRTHTSPVQIRTMRTQAPPIRVIIPGRTYRHDSDQTHTPMFHQVEGLVIDTSSNIAHMRWVWRSSASVLRGRAGADALPPVLLPLHRALGGRSTSSARAGAARSASGKASDWLEILGCGWCTRTCCATAGSTRRGPGLRLGHGHRPHRHAEIRHAGPAARSSRRTCAG
jgi:phenylalanyl-tRNA synthetase alpha chain